jgi:N-acetylmuramoyl-L-alanine amidase
MTPAPSRGLIRTLELAGILLLCPAAHVALHAQQEPALEVRDVRFWSLGEVTRIAVETSGDFEYRYERLKEPDRIFFDVQGAHWRTGARIHEIAVGDALVKRIRVAQTQPDVTRIVLDLAVPADFSAAQLANPDRLMIELRPAVPKPPAETGAAHAAPPTKPEPLPVRPPVQAAPVPKAQPAADTAPSVRAAAPVKAEPPPKPQPVESAKPAEDRVAQPASRTNAGSRTLVRALGLKLGRVVIDPGHGGHDTGSIGPGGLLEKDLVLDIGLRLGKLIGEELGAEVVFTRSDDTYVALEDRTALANEKKADLFLSVHANSGNRSAVGPETYYLNFTASPGALDVAARENASSEKTIHELQDLIEKIALKEKVDESREFAGSVQSALHLALGKGRSLKDRGVRKAPFVVLIGAQMPSVLAEVAFLSNQREERLLRRPDYRQKVAEGLFKGVAKYASSLSHFQVAESKKTETNGQAR